MKRSFNVQEELQYLESFKSEDSIKCKYLIRAIISEPIGYKLLKECIIDISAHKSDYQNGRVSLSEMINKTVKEYENLLKAEHDYKDPCEYFENDKFDPLPRLYFITIEQIKNDRAPLLIDRIRLTFSNSQIIKERTVDNVKLAKKKHVFFKQDQELLDILNDMAKSNKFVKDPYDLNVQNSMFKYDPEEDWDEIDKIVRHYENQVQDRNVTQELQMIVNDNINSIGKKSESNLKESFKGDIKSYSKRLSEKLNSSCRLKFDSQLFSKNIPVLIRLTNLLQTYHIPIEVSKIVFNKVFQITNQYSCQRCFKILETIKNNHRIEKNHSLSLTERYCKDCEDFIERDIITIMNPTPKLEDLL